ncbi:RNA polymerase sigma-70 factor, ECF subfamily [Variovorax sp. OK605]|jgi:RNA polymerase sigma factor (sigma-70 family)|uniref:RNA polymerase sigma factor n=1 Tax=Variovorax sp. OK605 TaxID=1855317 RepID=UPI0008E060CD|nr:sigma-70 family RNA polymerase sigma factor [Variovorax sp. OK605]SFQ21901.1 RNA polymerase sigma-70 factor, ECF subfamily [Variovorax sp. OK605]
MAEDTRPVLMDYLSRHYDALKRQLGRALRNTDLAEDALHDTWLRVNDQGKNEEAKTEDGPIRKPGGYLVRMAFNIALDIQRRQSRNLPFDEVDALMELADTAPGPARTVEARSQLDAVVRLLDRMPARRREVVVLVHMEGLTQPEAARRLGVSLRTVEYELKSAHDYLSARMSHDE